MSVEPCLWNALAGLAAAPRVPAQGSYVFFFPEGYRGQSLPEELRLSNALLCRVSSICLLADHDTDEVFAKIGLDPHPITDPNHLAHTWTPVACSSSTPEIDCVVSVGEFTSFTKILTKTDAGRVLNVPNSCALAVFPPVHINVNMATLTEDVLALDVHGRSWNFQLARRSYRQRYTLYKWREFANEKGLIKDDTVVFAKHRAGNLYIGVRHTAISSYARKRASMQEASIVKATQLARAGLPFEVTYYPGVESPEHVVAAVPMPHQVFRVEGATEASQSSSKGKQVQGVPQVQSLDHVKRSRGKVFEDDDSKKEGGSTQSLGASAKRSFKLFGRDIQ